MSINQENQEKGKKVLMAFSGGVDSSVGVHLLQKQGYQVTGAFMKNWSDTKNKITGECSWIEERRFAIKIAAKLKIPIITFDFEEQYKKRVVEPMFQKYEKGITPNPDIDCNNKIKFPFLLREAKKLGCDLIATGHYARIKKNKKGKYELFRAKDESKDQSYFLYRLSQRDLKKTLFPVGELTKKQVREIAKKQNFPNYNKKGTVGICFIGKINLKNFLQQKIKPKRGNILDPDGNKIGEHDGIYYYTIGQRIGPRFGIDIQRKGGTKPKKWYVVNFSNFHNWSQKADLPWRAIKPQLEDTLNMARTLWPKALAKLPMLDEHKKILKAHWLKLHKDFKIIG